MSVYVITYYVKEDHHDCGCDGHDHEHHHHHADDKLIMKIETLGAWAHFMPTGFLVKTSMTANEILDELEPMVGAKDLIFVSKINAATTASLTPQVVDWIEKKEEEPK